MGPKGRNNHVGNYRAVVNDRALDERYQDRREGRGSKECREIKGWGRRRESETKEEGMCARCHGEMRGGW